MNKPSHIVKSYEEQLKLLEETIIKMGTKAEEQLSMSIDAFAKKDLELARKIIAEDEVIDAYENSIEHQVVNLIALRQPMGIDLRETVTALKISSDLERIGDLSKNIAKKTMLINKNLSVNLINSFNLLGNKVKKQLKSVIDSYLERSKNFAKNVWESDEQADILTNQCMEDVIKYLKEDEQNLQNGAQLLFIAKNLERIGDHTTNIAEQVYFLVTGEYLEGDRPKNTESEML
ncbi:MAG: phosphate signaling complex protein PhoU [Pelagibacteraceae bacterium]|nr:phosphate signaling complex protein PhoU [Pelagibacteraceae bacterium]PHX88653.1 MAG: phosphate transport system regulatory protein PhoU [Pelagibacteraceae bacterium]